MKRLLFAAFASVFALMTNAQSATFAVDPSAKGIDISPRLYGLFYEEINHAGEGGLYAELIRNRSFEEMDEGLRNRRFDNGKGERFGRPENPNLMPGWHAVNGATMEVLTEELLNSTQTRALRLTATKATKDEPSGACNEGFWGIHAVKGDKYVLTFWAKTDGKKRVSFTTGLKADGVWKAQKVFSKTLTTVWKKYKVTFKGRDEADEAEFQLLLNGPGTICLDMVSLFPPTYKGRANGCRKDLAEKLVANPDLGNGSATCWL